MSETRKYSGGCHCGTVRYEVTADLSTGVIACNCSICSKKGYLLAFVPAEQFALISGDDALTEYRFNKNKIAHRFCKICGIQSFGSGEKPDGTKMVSVNARCLDGVDVASLKVKHFDGAKL